MINSGIFLSTSAYEFKTIPSSSTCKFRTIRAVCKLLATAISKRISFPQENRITYTHQALRNTLTHMTTHALSGD